MRNNALATAEVQQHFDSISGSYDEIKKKNWYYYNSLKKIVRAVVPPGKRVLDIGTGTGEILAFLEPSKGTGIDLSPGMIDKAKSKFSHLNFFCAPYESFETHQSFDAILLIDVIEHLTEPERFFDGVKKFCSPQTQVILTMANPAWEPVLEILEKLKLKMEEGPHFRVTEKKIIADAETAGFRVKSSDAFVLLPAFVPVLTPFFNEWLIHLPFVKKMALIKRFVFKKK